MTHFKRILLGCLALVLATALSAPAARADSLHRALKHIAGDIKDKRRAQGLADDVKPKKPLGSSKTVSFKLAMKDGVGQDSDSEYCFGYTLKCVAVVRKPINTFSGEVSSSGGGRVVFKDMKSGTPLHVTLQTDFLGDTTFKVHLRAQDEPYPHEIKVHLTCSY